MNFSSSADLILVRLNIETASAEQKRGEITLSQPQMGGFLKWWVSPTTMGFPTKNVHFGVWNGGTTI